MSSRPGWEQAGAGRTCRWGADGQTHVTGWSPRRGLQMNQVVGHPTFRHQRCTGHPAGAPKAANEHRGCVTTASLDP